MRLTKEQLKELNKEIESFRFEKTLSNGEKVSLIDKDKWLESKGAIKIENEHRIVCIGKTGQMMINGNLITRPLYEVLNDQFEQWSYWNTLKRKQLSKSKAN